LSRGRFDVTIGPLVKLWGIDTEDARVPAPEEIAAVLPLVDYRKAVLDPTPRRVFLQIPGMALDLGGIAKGAIADSAGVLLRSLGVRRALVNLGGNILAVGDHPRGRPWRIGIQDPWLTRGRYFAEVEIKDASVATSGRYERWFESGGVRYHHILDPRTGFPAETDIASVSVIAPKGIDADAMSTVVFLLGADEGLALLEAAGCAGAVIVMEDRRVIATPSLRRSLSVLDASYRLEFMERP
jgi:thiamine biosynthesis lipoprotein